MPKIIIKNPTQIAGIRKAGKLVREVLDMVGDYVKAGISTEELDNICNAYIMAHGGKSATKGYNGYPKYSCISLNDTICHGIPSSEEILQDGDILNVDITVTVDGYFADASRMYTVGEVSKEAKALIATTKEALKIGMAQVMPGNYFGNIGYAIANFVEPLGYGVVREYTGHGVGVKFHEEPFIYHKAQKNSGARMEPGMIFTIEPMINVGSPRTETMDDDWTVKTIDGSLSAQFEHTILVTGKGYEILT